MSFLRNFTMPVGAVAMALTLSVPVSAATVNTVSNVVFIVDESGSMGGEQAFLRDTVIDRLDADLNTAGVTNRSYGIVGYGGANNGVPRQIGTAGAFQDAAATKTSLGSLVTSGGFEDGYEAIHFALDTFTFTAGAAINFILVTDEDRDVRSGSTFNLENTLAALTGRKILLNAVVNHGFKDGNNNAAIGIDSDGAAYLANGSGGFTTGTGGVPTNGSGDTKVDYVDLALATGGAAWDLNLLRAGGNSALSFTDAFLAIKVQEITTQPTNPPSTVPLPAAAWLMIAGLGGLAAVGRRRRG